METERLRAALTRLVEVAQGTQCPSTSCAGGMTEIGPCALCGGSGLSPLGSRVVEWLVTSCRTCKGTGRYLNHSRARGEERVPCRKCSGTGRAPWLSWLEDAPTAEAAEAAVWGMGVRILQDALVADYYEDGRSHDLALAYDKALIARLAYAPGQEVIDIITGLLEGGER